MTIEQIIETINSNNNYKAEKLYFLGKTSNDSGFLYSDGKICFAIKSKEEQSENINTKLLSFKSHIYIDTLINDPSFTPSYYDILIFKGNIDTAYCKTFIDLCNMYISSKVNYEFKDFFFSLIDIFESESVKSFENGIGLFGELSFIKYIYEKYDLVITKHWHSMLGTNDKYDFCFKDLNIEVKTTIKKGMRFLIKHSQLFNEKNNFVAVINAEPDNSGVTLNDLFEYFRSIPPFASDLSFMINLEKEKNKVEKEIFESFKFNLVRITLFNTKKLETISIIPTCIDSISYMYDFANNKSETVSAILSKLQK